MGDKVDDKVDDDKVDYLDVDDNIPGQNYACLSFVSPSEYRFFFTAFIIF